MVKEGDWVLIKVAEILQDIFGKTDCIARVGGDEFMVFMPKLSENQHAYERIQNLLNRFPVMVEGGVKPIPVSLSIGVVFSRENEALSYAQLYEKADTAMYQAKKSGKGKAVFLNY